jgi:hypothetical protein
VAERTITIKEMIPAKAWPEIEALIKAGKVKAIDFKPVLDKYEAELLAKGVLVAYAAYALEFAVNQTKG